MTRKIKKLISVAMITSMVMMSVGGVFAETLTPEEDAYIVDFSSANTDIVCHQPSAANGTIEDGKLKMAVWWPTMINVDNHIFGDGTYEFDMNVGTDKDWAGVMFCKTNTTDIWDHSGYMLLVKPNGGFEFHQCSAGANKIADGTIENFVNQENHYKIVKDGISIKVYFGNSTTPIIDVTDGHFATGYFSFVGTSAGTNAPVTWDNLSIKPLENETTTELTTEEVETTTKTGDNTTVFAIAILMTASVMVYAVATKKKVTEN